MRLSLIIDIAAAAAVLSLLVYGFTGVALWVHIEPYQFGRLLIITAAHVAPIFISIVRRVQ